MNLETSLAVIADYLSLDANLLTAYAHEDTIGGYHHEAQFARFPAGSLYEVEGQTLYALVRALQPRHILELGIHMGASTTHLRSAVKANGAGFVTSVDIWSGAGKLIPESLHGYGELVFADAFKVMALLPAPTNGVDFVFADMLHGDTEARDVMLALVGKTASGTVVVHHDSEHGDDGAKIKRGVESAGYTDYLSLLAEPSDCGLLLTRMR